MAPTCLKEGGESMSKKRKWNGQLSQICHSWTLPLPPSAQRLQILTGPSRVTASSYKPLINGEEGLRAPSQLAHHQHVCPTHVWRLSPGTPNPEAKFQELVSARPQPRPNPATWHCNRDNSLNGVLSPSA